MANFTRFGHPSAEWLAHEEKNGIAPPLAIKSKPALEFQKATNAFREKAAAEQMDEENLHSRVQIHNLDLPMRDGTIIPSRVYAPKSTSSNPSTSQIPLYVHYHGGGFIYGSNTSEDATCARLIASFPTPLIVISICYRHSPQSRFPDPQHDVWDGYVYLTENFSLVTSLTGWEVDDENVVVGGVSAGAGFASRVALRWHSLMGDGKKRKQIKGQVLCIPWLVIGNERFPTELLERPEVWSREQCKDAPIVPQEVMEWFVELHGAPAGNAQALKENDNIEIERNKKLAIGLGNELEVKGLGNSAFLLSGMDPLRDDGLLFAQKLHDNGVPTKVHIFPGMPHGFRRFNELPSSRRWDQLLMESVLWVLKNQDPVSNVGGEIEIHEEFA